MSKKSDCCDAVSDSVKCQARWLIEEQNFDDLVEVQFKPKSSPPSTHEDLVRAALTTIQINNRFPVWMPPKEMDLLLEDILLRHCDMDKKDVVHAVIVAKKERLRRNHLYHLDLETVKSTFELATGPALDFIKTAKYVQYVDILSRQSTDTLLRIINDFDFDFVFDSV